MLNEDSETTSMWSQIQALQSFSSMSPQKLKSLTPNEIFDGINLAIHTLKNGEQVRQRPAKVAANPRRSADVTRAQTENEGVKEGAEHAAQQSISSDSESEESLEVIKRRARVQIQDESWVQRCRAATVLGQTADGDIFAIRSLVASLQDAHAAVRAAAASALAFAHRSQQKGNFAAPLEECVHGLLEAMNDDVVWVRLAVRDALVTCTCGGRLSGPMLSEVTSSLAIVKPQKLRYRVDDNAAAELEVEKTSALIGFLHGKGVDALPRTIRPRKPKPIQHSTSTSIHPYSFAGYQTRYPPEDREEPLDARDDLIQDVMVRAAVEALGVLGERDDSDQAVAALLASLKDRRWSVRSAAASALGCIGPTATAVTALAELLEDVDPSVRAAAATAIGNVASRPTLADGAEEIVCASQELIPALQDEEVLVRLAARAALVRCTDRGQWDRTVVSMVAALLSSKVHGVRDAGKECLAQMAGCLGKFVGKQREDVGKKRCESRRRGWVRETLVGQAEDADADKEERAMASEELIVYLDAKDMSADRWQKIHTARMDHPCHGVRRAAIAALIKTASETEQTDGPGLQPREDWVDGVISRLERALEDPDHVVRESAVAGLAQMCSPGSSSVTSSVLMSLQRVIETDTSSSVVVNALKTWQELSRGTSVGLEVITAIRELLDRSESDVDVKTTARTVAADLERRVSTVVSRLKSQDWVELLACIRDVRHWASRRGLRRLQQAGLKDCSPRSAQLVLAGSQDEMSGNPAMDGGTADCVLDVIKYQLRLQISISAMRARAPFVSAGGVRITEEAVWKGLEQEFGCSILVFDGFSMLPVRRPSDHGYLITMVVLNGHAFSVDRQQWIQVLGQQATANEGEDSLIAALAQLIGHPNPLVTHAARRALSEIPRKGCPEAIEILVRDAKDLLKSANDRAQPNRANLDAIWSSFGAIAALSSPSSETCLGFLCLLLKSNIPVPLQSAACMLAGQLARTVQLQCQDGNGSERNRDDEDSVVVERRRNQAFVSWVHGVSSSWRDTEGVRECINLLNEKAGAGHADDVAASARWALDGFPSAKTQDQMHVREEVTVPEEEHVSVKPLIVRAEQGLALSSNVKEPRLTLEEAFETLQDRFNMTKGDALQALDGLVRCSHWDARVVEALLGLAAERWPSIRRKALWILTDVAQRWKERLECGSGPPEAAPASMSSSNQNIATTKTTEEQTELLELVVSGMKGLLAWRDGSLVAHVTTCLGRCARHGDDEVVTALVKLSKSDVGSAPQQRTGLEESEDVGVDVRVAVLETLGRVASEADERMRAKSLSACEAKEDRVRSAAYQVVRKWAKRGDERVVSALVQLATDATKCAAARTDGAAALGELGAREDSRVLLALGGVLVNDLDATTRCAAAWSIANLRSDGDRDQVRVLQRARDDDAEPQVQEYIASLLLDLQGEFGEEEEASTAQECWERWQASLASDQAQATSTQSSQVQHQRTGVRASGTFVTGAQHSFNGRDKADQQVYPPSRPPQPGLRGEQTRDSSASGTSSRSQIATAGVMREKVSAIGGRAVVMCPGESRNVTVDGRKMKLRGGSSRLSRNPATEDDPQELSWRKRVESNSTRPRKMAARPWISLEVPPTSSSETELQDSTTLYLFDSRVRKWRRLRFIVRDKNAICQHESQQGRGFGEHKYLALSSTSTVEVITDGCFGRQLGRDHCFILRDDKDDQDDPGLLFSCDVWAEGELFIRKLQAEGVRFVNPGCRQPARRPTVARRSLSLMGKTMDAEEDAVHGASGNRDRPQRYAVKRVEATGIVR